MSLQNFGELIGGIGLFLIGIELVRSGFKEAAGNSLRRILSEYTDTNTKGIFSGFLVSSTIQSASAVTITIIGFVNAQILRLKQAVTVVLGSNLGKITTAWLITLLGLKINLTAVALPGIGIGVLLKAFLKKRNKGYGLALIGFAIIFFGINLLKESILNLSQGIDLSNLAHPGFWGTILLFFIGLAMTIVTQSSSAALAIALSATLAGLIPVECTAALVVGLNLGTTSGSYIAAIRTSPNAKRLAFAHITFNLVCTFVGLFLLTIIFHTSYFTQLAKLMTNDPVVGLTIFYTVFILASMIIVLPFEKRFVHWLKQHFHLTKSTGHPLYITVTEPIKHPPLLALENLQKEIIRFGKLSSHMLKESLTWDTKNGWVYSVDLSDTDSQLDHLNEYIHKYASYYTTKQNSEVIINQIQILCRSAQHFGLSSDLSDVASRHKNKLTERLNKKTLDEIINWSADVAKIVDRIEEVIQSGEIDELNDIRHELEITDEDRRALRYKLIEYSVMGKMKHAQVNSLIDIIETTRRSIRELIKGTIKLWKDHSNLQIVKQPESEEEDDSNVVPLKKL